VARVLIVGCGCRGRALARQLVADGHAVRGTTRDRGRSREIAAAGAEPWVGDPLRLASLTGALDGVTLVCWLLGSASATPRDLAALHGPRLRFFLERMVDTTVRGFVYEAAGALADELLEQGGGIAAEAQRTWEIPVAEIRASPADPTAWLLDAAAAVRALLHGDAGSDGIRDRSGRLPQGEYPETR
jgi:hypothetical protein